MHKAQHEPPRCANCDVEIAWTPVIGSDGQAYCCAGCAEGGPCACLYHEVWAGAA
jgi:hypothetical protein